VEPISIVVAGALLVWAFLARDRREQRRRTEGLVVNNERDKLYRLSKRTGEYVKVGLEWRPSYRCIWASDVDPRGVNVQTIDYWVGPDFQHVPVKDKIDQLTADLKAAHTRESDACAVIRELKDALRTEKMSRDSQIMEHVMFHGYIDTKTHASVVAERDGLKAALTAALAERNAARREASDARNANLASTMMFDNFSSNCIRQHVTDAWLAEFNENNCLAKLYLDQQVQQPIPGRVYEAFPYPYKGGTWTTPPAKVDESWGKKLERWVACMPKRGTEGK
jgi:hypothetical protein